MRTFIHQSLLVFFGGCLVSSTLLNLAFTIAPQAMTHWLMAMMTS